jgi:glucose dehydrogenase
LISRRQFIAGSAASVLGSVVACRGNGSASVSGVYDLCVVGSGFAGTLLALELARKGKRTILIEAGGGKSNLARSFDFNNEGEIPYPLAASRLIAPGGTSGHWSGLTIRFMPTDFKMRSLFGLDVDWPLEYDALKPYFLRAEQALSVDGYREMLGAEPPRGTSYPDEIVEPVQLPQMSYKGEPLVFFPTAASRRERGGDAVRMAGLELPEFARLDSATLLQGFQARRITTLNGKSVDHLKVQAADGTTHDVRARVFVVAAGVVESARLLLLSTSKWFPAGLGNAHDHVGRHFNEHPSFVSIIEPRSLEGIARGAFRTLSFADAFRREGLGSCSLQADLQSDEQLSLKVQPEIEPRPENRVTLSTQKRDFFGDPAPALHFSYSDRDRRTIARGQEIAEAQVKAFGDRWTLLRNEPRFRFHPAGVCRMAAQESDGVVDINNRVFGMDNLYVSGASVFPTSGTANPTLTVVALTLRLADHLAAQLGA